ncbi:hypothetical protein [Aestuariivirga sp.]|uniref:hypothetical protein n=1 Tax=Aestuariivirga sp. TaxID=2650926 RepID=UPI0035AEC478
MPRTADRDILFLSEAETARRLGKSLSDWTAIATVLEREGLSRVDPLFGGRYWPAVIAFFHNRYGLHSIGSVGHMTPDGKENLDALQR